jgi:hypothetical protein
MWRCGGSLAAGKLFRIALWKFVSMVQILHVCTGGSSSKKPAVPLRGGRRYTLGVYLSKSTIIIYGNVLIV